MSAESHSAAQSAVRQDFWAKVWRRFRRSQQGMVGLVFVTVLLVLALLAPLLANDRPIVARYQGDTVFPAFTTYVDAWVPWQSWRFRLQSWELGDMEPRYYPFSAHYPELEGQSWKEIADDPELTFAIWPLCFTRVWDL